VLESSWRSFSRAQHRGNQAIFELESTLKALDEEMAKRQKEVLDLELKYGINPNRKEEIKV
jgi:hypothetical protein